MPLSFITIICLAVLWQCSGETKSAGDAIAEGAENVEVMADDAADVTGDAVDAAGEAVDEAVQGTMTSDGERSFAKGTWAWELQDYLSNGSGEKTFTLDKLPPEGEEVSAEGKEQLDNLADLLKAYPDLAVEIQGHSRVGDGAAENTANQVSSKGRAVWVQTKLATRGVSGKQMSAKGIGGKEPMEGVDSKDISQRRITVKFTK